MKEILVISGKGGTGKTSITAALASLIDNIVIADCDVDAADLHLILSPTIEQEHEFISGHVANIDSNKCIKCGKCYQVCRFDAVKVDELNNYTIDPIACEGCGVCTWTCKSNAIDFNESKCGNWYVSDTRFGKMVHAELDIAAENSGKLVSLVRQKARDIAEEQDCDYILIDGPPGIGCPVIASMTGVDAIIIVTEPSLSAIHDMERVISLTRHFGIDIYVCINKSDVNNSITSSTKRRLSEMHIPLIGTIPYDKNFSKAQINKQSIIEYNSITTSDEIRNMCNIFINKIK